METARNFNVMDSSSWYQEKEKETVKVTLTGRLVEIVDSEWIQNFFPFHFDF